MYAPQRANYYMCRVTEELHSMKLQKKKYQKITLDPVDLETKNFSTEVQHFTHRNQVLPLLQSQVTLRKFNSDVTSSILVWTIWGRR
jgi:hypothetical protein